MSIVVDRATIPCGSCGAMVIELRRGRCWACYSKWAELRPVPRGAACAVCDEKRRDNLRLTELHSRSVTLCHICASRTLKLARVPNSIEGLRQQLLTRDRRQNDRRGLGMERRIFPRERRVGDRRGPPRASTSSDTNPGFVMPDFDDIEIEIVDADIEIVEQTLVREQPRR